MPFASADIRVLVENVFSATFGMGVEAIMDSPAWPPRRARIMIEGPWTGQVVIATTDALLRGAVAAMCNVPASECCGADLTDALLELANMLGGSVKSLLPDDCRLRMPVALASDESPPVGELQVDRMFRCNGHALRLQVVRALAAA